MVRRVVWFGLALIFLGVSGSARAQDPKRIGVQIAPLILEYTAPPGGELVGQLQLFNPLDQPQPVNLVSWDFAPADEQGALRFFDGVSEASASQWIFLQPTELELGPKEEVIIPFVIQVPVEAREGTHTAVVFAQASEEMTKELSGSGVQVAAGAIFLVDVVSPGPKDPKLWSGRIVELKLQGLKPLAGLPLNWVGDELELVVRFENTGLYQQKVRGDVQVKNVLGRVIGLDSPLELRVLPQAIVQFRYPWTPKFLLGHYQVEPRMTYGRTQELVVSQPLSFWAVNQLGLVFLFLALIIGLILIRRLWTKTRT